MTTTTGATEAKPIKWLEQIKTSEDSKCLHKIHNAAIDHFQVTTADELTQCAHAKMLDSTIDLNVNSILVRSLMGKAMITNHQILKVDGNLLNPILGYFAFTGFGTSATPV